MNIKKLTFLYSIGGLFSLRKEYKNRPISDKHLSFKDWFKLYQLYEDQQTNIISKKYYADKIKDGKKFLKLKKSKPILEKRNPELMKISTKRLLTLFKHRYRGGYYVGDEDYYGDKKIWIGNTNQRTFNPSEIRNELNHREHIK